MANPFAETVEESYNPFAGGFTESAPAATFTPDPETPSKPAHTPARGGFEGTVTSMIASASGATIVDKTTGLPITESQVALRERQLADRERKIAEKEQQLAQGGYRKASTRKNFPPLLKWWEYYPNEDLPENARKHAKIIFWIFVATGAVYLVNLIGAFACLGAKGASKTSVGMLIGLGVCFFLVFWPLSFEVCYFVYYKALMTGKGVRFFCSLAMYALWWGLLVFNVIGIEDGGSVGFCVMINLFQGKQAAIGTIGVVFVILGIADIVAMGWMFVMLCRWYKQQGLDKRTFAEVGQYAAEKAVDNKETIAGVMSDPVVMDAAMTTYG